MNVGASVYLSLPPSLPFSLPLSLVFSAPPFRPCVRMTNIVWLFISSSSTWFTSWSNYIPFSITSRHSQSVLLSSSIIYFSYSSFLQFFISIARCLLLTRFHCLLRWCTYLRVFFCIFLRINFTERFRLVFGFFFSHPSHLFFFFFFWSLTVAFGWRFVLKFISVHFTVVLTRMKL